MMEQKNFHLTIPVLDIFGHPTILRKMAAVFGISLFYYDSSTTPIVDGNIVAIRMYNVSPKINIILVFPPNLSSSAYIRLN